MNRFHQAARGLLTGVATLALASMANAQTAAPAAAAEGELELNEVVVTGSRVISNGNDSPTPVTVVTVEELQTTHPATVFESLLDLPAFAGSRGSTVSGPGTAGGSNGANNGQISALSLRGLGPVRTLLLYDGHRVPATQQNGLVDANTIPQMLLQRVDVVTGGASAVYGSDAVGGVVNFITDRKFNGVKVETQGGISQQRDAGTYQFGAAFGTDLFGGRGHIEASAQAFHDDGILHAMDRGSPFTDRWKVFGDGTDAFPYFQAANGINTTATWGGKIVGPGTAATNPLLNYHFSTNGVAVPFVQGSSAGINNAATRIGGDGFYFTATTLKSWSEQQQLYGRFDFDVNDNLHYYLTTSGTLDHSLSYTNNANQFNIQLRSTNAYLPTAYQNQLLGAGVTTFGYSKVWGPGSPFEAQNGDFYTRALYINTGLEGKLGNYNWDVSYTRSDVDGTVQNNWTPNLARLFAAMDAVTVTAANVGTTGLTVGSIACSVALTNPGLYPGCVPVNLFGPTSETQAAANYIRENMVFISKMPTDNVSAFIAGAPFNSWAGPVNLALSGEWRKQGFEQTSSAPTVNFAPMNCTGLATTNPSNCITPTATNPGTSPYMGAVAPRTPVSMTVSEAALEAGVPVLKDVRFAQAADVNLAYRYAKYKVDGNADLTKPSVSHTFNSNTWKTGLNWHVNDALMVRATRSRDLRAPNLADLFAPISTTFGGGNQDRWTNSNLTPAGSNPAIVSGGNANLLPEVAHTTTVGAVLKPTPNFSVALDYFSISITDYIVTINGATPVIQDACYNTNIESYCALQERPFPLSFSRVASVNAVTKWYTVPLNFANMQTEGVDLETNYKTTLAGRAFSLRGLVTYQPHVALSQFAAQTQDTAGQIGGAGARVRLSLFAHFNPTERIGIDWQTRWRDKLRFTSTPIQVALENTEAKSVSFSNLNLSYKFDAPLGGQAQAFLNIQNVFDTAAPIIGLSGNFAGNGGGFASGDDPIGRYYTLGVRYKL